VAALATLCAAAAVVAALSTAGAAPVRPAVAVTAQTDLQVVTALRRDGLQYTWHARVDQVGPTGACGTNAAYEAGQSSTFYVEQQACAEDVLIPALLDQDGPAIEVALRALDWAFAHQAADGSFRGGADTFHSASVFLPAAARVVLLLRQSPLVGQYTTRLDSYVEPMRRAAQYLARPDVLGAGRSGDAPYGHRRFLVGAALGLVGDVADDTPLKTAARGLFEEGMALQRPDGSILERGGPDSHYQAYGMTFALTWLANNPRDPLAARLAATMDRASAWEAARVGPDGAVSIEGNTRTAGQERNRDGTPKKLIYHSVIRALGGWAVLRPSPSLLTTAQRVAAYKRDHPDA